MRGLLFLGLALAGGLAQAKPLGFEDARHLLMRTGFAASEAQVEAYARLSRDEAVGRLLGGTIAVAVTPPPAWINDPIVSPRQIKAMSEEAKKEFVRARVREGIELRAWWLREMLETPSPLTEKMTLFWHSHFATSQQKVKANQLMYRQNVLLRQNALGNFGTLLHAVAKDPAMIVYLDSVSNRRGQPNENFAREVMELFTLGEGNYTEQDIREAARAFTGWSLERDTAQFLFRRGMHDNGVKTVLGRSGNFDGDAILDILLQRPQTAEFVTRKLWREFISPSPDESEVKRLARVFRDGGYEIKPLLHAMLTSEAFYAPPNRGTLVKSPVELVAGTLKQFSVRADDLRPAAVTLAFLGQNLFSPPNVKGWPGGDDWINSTTLLGRKQFLDRLLRTDAPAGATNDMQGGLGRQPTNATLPASAGKQDRLATLAARVEHGMQAMRFDADRWTAQFGDAASSRRIERLLLAVAPQEPPPPGLGGVALVRALVLDPAYQLK